MSYDPPVRKLEDDASANADAGVPVLAVRQAAPANTSGTDGDYENLRMANGRLWCSVTIDAALPAGTNNIGDVDVLTLPAPFGAAGATSIAKVEDVASANADVGVPFMYTQRITPSNLADANGDYEIAQGYQGGLWTRRPNSVGTATTITALDAVVGAPGGLGVTVSGASTAGSLVSQVALGGEDTFTAFFVAGSFTGTIYFEGSMNSSDGTNGSWTSLSARREGVWEGQDEFYGHTAAGAATNGIYRGSLAGFTYFRVRLVGSVFTSAPTITIVLSSGSAPATLGAQAVSFVSPFATYRGRCATFRTPGRAGTAGQKIFAIHNATASTKIVQVKRIRVDKVETVVKAVTVLPPVVRAHRVTVLPTNGTAGSKVAKDSSLSSSASVTVFQDASADGTSSASALTATIPAGSCLAEEFAPRLITAAGYEVSDKIEFDFGGDEIVLRALEGVVVFLDYVLATQNPVTDMWVVTCDWEEK